jgi:perosamine synthetase
MGSELTYLLRDGNFKKLISAAESNPFPGVIGTFMGRDALSLAVSCLGLKPDDTVLLPAYLCREVLRPFLGKTRVMFYDVMPNLAADPADIRQIVAKNKVKVMMIINFFGFLQPYRKEIKEICSESGITLIEDCAHSLLTEGSGDVGDISIYSFRKILPVPDGGGLSMNPSGNAPSPEFYPRLYSNVLSILIITKALMDVKVDSLSRAGFADKKKDLLQDAPATPKCGRVLPLSSFTRNGMGNMVLPEIFEKRRSDFTYWQDVAGKTDRITPVFPELPMGVCPLGYPVKLKDRDVLRARLQKEGIFLKVHWNLPDEVGAEHVNSHAMAKQSITFPLHFELGQRESDGIERLLVS